MVMADKEKENAIDYFSNILKCEELTNKGACKYSCDECDFSTQYMQSEEYMKYIRAALEALKQEPCEDVISRKAVKDAVENVIVGYIPILTGSLQKIPLELAKAINKVPNVTPTQETSEWIYSEHGNWSQVCVARVKCKKCGYKRTRLQGDILKFCPNCGAKIKGTNK